MSMAAPARAKSSNRTSDHASFGRACKAAFPPSNQAAHRPMHPPVEAPPFAGQNRANPLATIMAVSMMLDYLGERAAAARVEHAVVDLLRARVLPNLGMDSGYGTDRVGNLVLERLEAAARS